MTLDEYNSLVSRSDQAIHHPTGTIGRIFAYLPSSYGEQSTVSFGGNRQFGATNQHQIISVRIADLSFYYEPPATMDREAVEEWLSA